MLSAHDADADSVSGPFAPLPTFVLVFFCAQSKASGIAEVVKYGLIKDSEFFEWQEGCMEGMAARDEGVLAEAVERSCVNKAEVR